MVILHVPSSQHLACSIIGSGSQYGYTPHNHLANICHVVLKSNAVNMVILHVQFGQHLSCSIIG